MRTLCNPALLRFQPLGRRRVEARFDGGHITSDAGVLLLREVAQHLQLFSRLAACFSDFRDPNRVEHTLQDLLAQRILALACGYEDLNDHDTLRRDPLLAAAVGKTDPMGANRRHDSERGRALASSSTLNRLELAPQDAADAATHRYAKFTWNAQAIEDLLIELAIERFDAPPPRIILDADATDDPLHGHQEGRFFHGYYKNYCYLPLYIFWGDFPLWAELRTADIDGSAGTLEALERIVTAIRRKWPEVDIWVRADSGFARESLMAWCEEQEVTFVLGLAKNKRLKAAIAEELTEVAVQAEARGEAVRQFKELEYSTRKTWSRSRRVVAKVEHLPGKANPRFVVTSLDAADHDGQTVYEQHYAARGDMENRIKEQQLGLFADRTSTQTMRANQLRLWFSTVAYVLLEELRRLGLKETALARAQAWTLRQRLLKIGARVRVSVRRVKVSMSSAFPLQEVFETALARLSALEPRPVPG